MMGKIILLTGEIESGKTSYCLDVLKIAREQRIQVAGLLSPGIFEGGEKISIDALNLKSGTRRRLAELKENQTLGLETKRWSFYPEVVLWGNQVLQDAIPTDLLMVDELGPLEFHQNSGWINGFDVLESNAFQVALVVIRPSLIKEASQHWNIAQTIDLSAPGSTPLSGSELFEFLGLSF